MYERTREYYDYELVSYITIRVEVNVNLPYINLAS